MEDGHPHPASVEIDASRYNILLGTGPRFVLLRAATRVHV
jgi:hypothetical protein